ncbi:hypothetical protein F4703DRAFT_1918170 [Phycomyces blakesleeanus]
MLTITTGQQYTSPAMSQGNGQPFLSYSFWVVSETRFLTTLILTGTSLKSSISMILDDLFFYLYKSYQSVSLRQHKLSITCGLNDSPLCFFIEIIRGKYFTLRVTHISSELKSINVGWCYTDRAKLSSNMLYYAFASIYFINSSLGSL